jgi:type II secretory pathway pseudopilin PulG
MKNVKMREAFSMITAIFVIVIMASIGALVMSVSGKIVKTTTAQYQHEQAILYAKSYTEFAVMAVTANDRSVSCTQDITGTIGTPATGNGYRIRTRIAYIVNATVNTAGCDATRVLSAAVTTLGTPLTIIIDAYVDYKDPDNMAQWRTVHRRTVQKI